MTKKHYKITRGRTELTIPHEKGEITFVSPARGPGNYLIVQEKIEEAGLIMPTFAQLVSLVYTASQNRGELEFQDVLDKFNRKILVTSTGSHYLDYKGVYIRDNFSFRENGELERVSQLQKMIKNKDKRVRFVPFGFEIGEQSPSRLVRNPYVIGLAGKEGAKKLVEISKNCVPFYPPYIYGLKSFQGYIRVMTRLDGNADRLTFGANHNHEDLNCYSWGIVGGK
ncbi:MAG: hypothetical protein Q8L27_02405 [archaeon]|nr:hypothetical protein [archaeon]